MIQPKPHIQQLIYLPKDLPLLGIKKSNTTLLRWEGLGRFPRRVRLGGTSVGWLASEIDSWLKDRAEERARHVYAEYYY
jgi:predicted DNA-binding transcriptional regulator AlpA